MITINIKEDLWIELNKRKRVGESFNDLLIRLLNEEPPIKRGKKK